jgi:site-specific DNA recombinase
MCQNLSKIWGSSTLDNKMKMQKVLFPEGLTYDYPNQVYRTKRVNSIVLCIAQLARVSGENKARNSAIEEQNSARVARDRIEPDH